MFKASHRLASASLLRTAVPQRGLRSYDSKHKAVTVIPGDGIGPEVTRSAIGVMQAAGTPVDFETIEVAEGVLSPELVASVSRNEVVLKGPLATARGTSSRNQALRNSFSLHANVVKISNLPGVAARHPNINLVIVRHNLEGEYSNLEFEIVPGVVNGIKVTTAVRSKQIAEYAFEYARKNGRKKVTAVHKANIQKLTDGLFLTSAREVAKNYPEIKLEEMIVDNTAMQLVMNPGQFDVMLTPNLYGNICTNIAVGLVGGPGVVAGQNHGHRVAVFEPGARHTGADIAGQDKANPTAMILASANMLRHLDLVTSAEKIEKALFKTLADKVVLTADLGGSSTTRQFTQAVIRNL